MASEKRPSSGSQGTRRRRPAPTIDLKATEVAPAPVPPAGAPEAQPAQQRQDDPPPDTATGSSETTSPRHGIAWLPPGFPWPLVGAGAAGGVAVLLLFVMVWLLLPGSGDPTAALTPRLAAIETQLRDLAARPVPAGIDPKAVEALSARLAKLETVLNAPRPAATADPALAGRIGVLESAVKPLGASVAALARRADEIDTAFRDIRGRADALAAAQAELQGAARSSTADQGEFAKLADRIAVLEKSDRAIADRLAKSVATSSDRPVRLALATAALRAALDRGEPFTAELAAVQTLSKDSEALAALGPFAASGMPSAAALGRELLVLLPVMQRAAGTAARDGGFLDRLQANAERLVRIRPVDEVAGEDAAAILSRIEVKAARADIAGTLAEIAKLPPAVRSLAADWTAKAEARRKAAEAGRRLAADAVAALKSTP